MNDEELLYLARGFGFDDDSIELVYQLCDQHNLSPDMRERMIKAYEEGYDDH